MNEDAFRKELELHEIEFDESDLKKRSAVIFDLIAKKFIN
jgi:hypothetical protein